MSESGKIIHDRRSERIPVALEIEYRSAGAFLVAYATNLSRGGLFLETGTPLPVGTRIGLRLRAPDATAIDLTGIVAWVRPASVSEGHAPGMGIEFETPESAYGPVVDQIAARFAGIKILVATGEPAPRALLHRYLRSILACEILESEEGRPFPAAAKKLDLVVVDMDSSGARAAEILSALRAESRSIPIIALAQNDADRRRAASLGADETVPSPPTFGDLQAAVIRTLSRPSAVR